MPGVPDGWLRSVVHLYMSEEHAKVGAPYGGTAFLVGVRGVDARLPENASTYRQRLEFEQDASMARSLYVATALHNLIGGATVLRFNTAPTESEPYVVHTDLKGWIRSPEHDLAVLPVDLDVSVDFDAIPSTRLIESDELAAQYRPGHDVFMVGRFVDEGGRAQNQVQVRFGNISMVPGDSVKTEAGDRLVAFLVEMRSRSGFSGSPVFAYSPAYGAVLRGTSGMEEARVLGVDHGQYPTLLDVVDEDGRVISGFKVRERSALSVVVPAPRLIDLLMREELVEAREQGRQQDR